MLQHIFNKNAETFCGILNKYMGNRPYNLPVLDDWTSAHALHDSPRQLKKLRISNPKNDSFIHVLLVPVYFQNFHLIILKLTAYRTANLGLSSLDLLFISYLKRFPAQFLSKPLAASSKDASLCILSNGSADKTVSVADKS